MLVAVAEVIAAFAPPKYTTQLPTVVGSVVPVMVTVVPAAPEAGEKEVITGWQKAERLRMIPKSVKAYLLIEPNFWDMLLLIPMINLL